MAAALLSESIGTLVKFLRSGKLDLSIKGFVVKFSETENQVRCEAYG